MGFIGAHFYPHWFEMDPGHAKMYPFYAKCWELGVPIQMQVGQSIGQTRCQTAHQGAQFGAFAVKYPELVAAQVIFDCVDHFLKQRSKSFDNPADTR